ncbi:hypothetical protein F7D01_04000 [Erythrobacter sp. 3-20A1M]|uniref:hypothetical protein n=1 Tax=Erythrobacter sp. 3-20A1M TaxID=2653850 RepID=UPI001BFC7050|nr:hypothetical protein [Erythrobacter sp. 3-20A1M]QWC58273.1 hypothetical protein F7D01_04000 [Erythrobacter sp. 3-20A1M]
MEWFRDLVFASDAEIMALWGGGFLLFAVVALVAERSRVRRARIDRVGWVPWTGLFLLCAVIGGGLLALSMPSVLKG